MCLAWVVEPPELWCRDVFPEGKAAPLREQPGGCAGLGLPPTPPHTMDLGLSKGI